MADAVDFSNGLLSINPHCGIILLRQKLEQPVTLALILTGIEKCCIGCCKFPSS